MKDTTVTVKGRLSSAAEVKKQFIQSAREFLDSLEQNQDQKMESGMLAVTYPNDGGRDTTGVTVGDYDDLISTTVQMGLALGPQGLAKHKETDCEHSDDDPCDLDESNCVILSSVDMIVDILANVINDAPLTAAVNAARRMESAFQPVRKLLMDRMRNEEPEKFFELLDASPLSEENKQLIRDGKEPDVSGIMETLRGGEAVFAAEATPEMLRALLTHPDVPEEMRANMQEAIDKMETESADTRPNDMSANSTFVKGDKSTKH